MSLSVHSLDYPIKGLYMGTIQSVSQEASVYNVTLQKAVLVNSLTKNKSFKLPSDEIHVIQEADVFVQSSSDIPQIHTDTLKSYLKTDSNASQNKAALTYDGYCDENIEPPRIKEGILTYVKYSLH